MNTKKIQEKKDNIIKNLIKTIDLVPFRSEKIKFPFFKDLMNNLDYLNEIEKTLENENFIIQNENKINEDMIFESNDTNIENLKKPKLEMIETEESKKQYDKKLIKLENKIDKIKKRIDENENEIKTNKDIYVMSETAFKLFGGQK